MESIVTNLHLDLTAFIWHSINFVVLTAALWWLLFRPLMRLIDERRLRIQESLMRAEEIDREAAAMQAEREAVIQSAHREAAEIRRRAQDQVHRYITRSRARATADADRIREQATLRHGSVSVDSDLEDGGRTEVDLKQDV
jgi:F-type H+-transporting ATPase subunit b